MKTKEIKPSDCKKSNQLPKDAVIQIAFSDNKQGYYWYKSGDIWMPHRRPTLSEIDKDKFN